MKRHAGALAVATCVVAAFGAASAGERSRVASIVCSEFQRTKRHCERETDADGPHRICFFDQVGQFRATFRMPLADLGRTFRRLDLGRRRLRGCARNVQLDEGAQEAPEGAL